MDIPGRRPAVLATVTTLLPMVVAATTKVEELRSWVTGTFRLNWVPLMILATEAPRGMPVPEMTWPTVRPAVLATVIVLAPLRTDAPVRLRLEPNGPSEINERLAESTLEK